MRNDDRSEEEVVEEEGVGGEDGTTAGVMERVGGGEERRRPRVAWRRRWNYGDQRDMRINKYHKKAPKPSTAKVVNNVQNIGVRHHL